MVLVDSNRVSAPFYSGYSNQNNKYFVYRTITLYGATFQLLQLSNNFVTPKFCPTTPDKSGLG